MSISFYIYLIQKISRQYLEFKSWMQLGRKYQSNLDLFRLIRVNLNSVNVIQSPEPRNRFNRSGYLPEVLNGDWDREVQKLEDYGLYRAVQPRFLENIDKLGIEIYSRVKKETESGKIKFDCSTIEEFETQLNQFNFVYNNIRKDGYIKQQKLIEDNHVLSEQRSRRLPPEAHEVTLNIGRTGEFILHERRHTLSLTQLVDDIHTISVRIKMRHEKWTDVREDCYLNRKTNLGYPDIL